MQNSYLAKAKKEFKFSKWKAICGHSPWQWLCGDLGSTCRFWREGKVEASLSMSPGERWGSP